ncbi:MAG: YicC family protein [Bacteroidales bacterium]|nr:YicC family protein [Bacteroidales bacterium]
MKSMTGYAKTQVSIGEKNINIELKTLNSKQLDLNTKVPTSIRSKEIAIRTMLNSLERGKIDLYIYEEQTSRVASLDADLLSARASALANIANQLNMSSNHVVETIATMSDLWNAPSNNDISDAEWALLRPAIEETIAQCDAFRSQEGEILEKDIVKHLDCIEKKLQEIPTFEQERIDTARTRINKYLAEWNVKEVDTNRLEQEMIYYLEKLDITEEKVRLQKHIDYFRNTLKEEPSCGKKLSFITQEMGREINTTGSKANHAEIQKIVVEMKDELEKIKEQLGNIL